MTKLISFWLFFSLHLYSFSQKKAENALETVYNQYPQEKIHLFFNKTEYVAGENIWFKAYLFSGYVPSYISTNMYVELFNDKRVLIDQIQIPLLNSVGQGSLKISPKAYEGVYYVRAYTNWMLNFKEQFQSFNELLVYNESSVKKLAEKKVQWYAHYYPESGTLLSGEANKVTVRLSSTEAFPKKWGGYITEFEDSSKRILSFESVNPQLSYFNFTPEKNKVYILNCFDELGNHNSTLMRPSSKGIVLKAAQQGNDLTVNILFREYLNNGLNYKVLAHMQGQLIYTALIKSTEADISCTIPVGSLPDGVVHLTLFDEEEQPVAERLVFIDVEKNLPELKIEAGEVFTTKRALNEWTLQMLSDSTDQLNYAVSIMDASIARERKKSIMSDLWLSDFGPSVYSPASYFTNYKPASAKTLDALLISEQWQRFQWPDILAGNFPQLEHSPEKFLFYTGSVRHKGKPIIGGDVNLLFQYSDSSTRIVQVRTDSAGKFHMAGTLFFDTLKVFYQPNKSKVSPKEITINFEASNQFSPLIISSSLPTSEYMLTDKTEAFPSDLVKRENQTRINERNLHNKLKESDKKYKVLEEIEIAAKKRTATADLVKSLASGLYQASDAATFDFVNEDQLAQGFTDIYAWLEGKVPGLGFFKTSSGAIPYIRGVKATVLINEIPLIDSTISHIAEAVTINDIALVQVILGYSVGLWGGGGGGGTILIYTKKPAPGVVTKTSLRTAKIVGYRTTADITNINYDDIGDNFVEKDTRVQLYWNQNRRQNKIRFFNNDIASAFFLTITGVNSDGRPIFIEKIIR